MDKKSNQAKGIVEDVVKVATVVVTVGGVIIDILGRKKG